MSATIIQFPSRLVKSGDLHGCGKDDSWIERTVALAIGFLEERVSQNPEPKADTKVREVREPSGPPQLRLIVGDKKYDCETEG